MPLDAKGQMVDVSKLDVPTPPPPSVVKWPPTRIFPSSCTASVRTAPFAPGSNFRLTAGWHSHNDYLQIWYETGAVGAI